MDFNFKAVIATISLKTGLFNVVYCLDDLSPKKLCCLVAAFVCISPYHLNVNVVTIKHFWPFLLSELVRGLLSPLSLIQLKSSCPLSCLCHSFSTAVAVAL